jgi:hypothetical protein
LEVLIYLSTIGGAGILTSWLFSELRRRVQVGSTWHELLYSPFNARWIVLVASVGIATAAAYAAQALGGPPADPAVSAAWAFITSQIMHAIRELPVQAPFDKPER